MFLDFAKLLLKTTLSSICSNALRSKLLVIPALCFELLKYFLSCFSLIRYVNLNFCFSNNCVPNSDNGLRRLFPCIPGQYGFFKNEDFGEKDLSAFKPRFSPTLLDNFSFGPV